MQKDHQAMARAPPRAAALLKPHCLAMGSAEAAGVLLRAGADAEGAGAEAAGVVLQAGAEAACAIGSSMGVGSAA